MSAPPARCKVHPSSNNRRPAPKRKMAWLSFPTALRALGLERLHKARLLREKNRAKISHLPVRQRERRMQGFINRPSAQRFLATYADVYNTFSVSRQLVSRANLRHLRAGAHAAWAKTKARNGQVLADCNLARLAWQPRRDRSRPSVRRGAPPRRAIAEVRRCGCAGKLKTPAIPMRSSRPLGEICSRPFLVA